jgi:hypothetical protein
MRDTSSKSTSKLKAFIKRSSEPLLNMQPQQVKRRKKIAKDFKNFFFFQFSEHQTLIIEEFEPDVFR